jgi:CRISPR-associated protein Cmr1
MPLDFELRFITPAFVGSMPAGEKTVRFLQRDRQSGQMVERTVEAPYYPIDPSGIRIPSLRGVLEFWYRSLHGHCSSREVFARQESVFGSVRVGQGLRLRPLGMPHIKSGELRFSGDLRYPSVYLGYGPLQLLRVPHPQRPNGDEISTSYNRSQCRDAVLIEREPARFHFRAEGSPSQLVELQRSLTLLHLFGGLGSRSRRGWGSVEVVADFLPAPPIESSVPAWIATLLASAGLEKAPEDAPAPRFSAFSPKSRIYVTESLTDGYEAVLFKFHQHLKRVRSWPDRAATAVADHDSELADAQDGRGAVSRVPTRLAFGMPYQPRFRTADLKIDYVGRVPGQRADDDLVTRRASPLLLKVHRLSRDRHVGIALFLESEFFGNPRVEIGAQGKPRTQPFPGYAAIHEFFDSKDWTAVDLS